MVRLGAIGSLYPRRCLALYYLQNRFILIGASLIAIVLGAFFWEKKTRIVVNDCQIAAVWFSFYASDGDDFATFLRDRYRVGDKIGENGRGGGQYSVAIIDEKFERAKAIDFLYSRSGDFSDGRRLSISVEEWSNHKIITCN